MANKIYVANEQTVQSVKTEVNGIQSKLGIGADASSSSTIFGKLNGMVSTNNTILGRTNDITNKVGNVSDASSFSTIFGKLNSMVSTSNTILGRTNDITNKVGNVSDVSYSSTVFGKLNGMGVKIPELLQKIGNTADTASQQTIFGKLKGVKDDISRINTNTAKGMIKSIQKGTAVFESKGYYSYSDLRFPENKTITISAINPNKCIILLQNSLAGAPIIRTQNGSSDTHMPGSQSVVASIQATNFVLTPCYNLTGNSGDNLYWKINGGTVYWQIIEFY